MARPPPAATRPKPRYEFLVHTELCTMNYDGLGVTEDVKLRHMIRMMENLHVPQTLRKPAGEILPFVYDIKQSMRANPYRTRAGI